MVGRESELAELCALLRKPETRLVTLTGPGGVGKSRLAVAAATELTAFFADGVRFVSLSELTDHRLVADAITRSLGDRESSVLTFGEQVQAVAGESELLLLIDNFEHLLPSASRVSELLSVCPGVTALVTSRERLRISGERDLPVYPLAYPDPERSQSPVEVSRYPSVRLFVERAEAADPSFALSETNTAAVAAICQRLDGLPLALELAAARSPHLSPAGLLSRLAYRLPLLTDGPRDAPARLRTMRDAVAWSYDLLTPSEQAVFRRCGVFVGGFTIAAVEQIAATTIEPSGGFAEVAALVDASLLRREIESAGEPRFGMLETVREYAIELLTASDELTACRQRHAEYFLDLAERAEPELRGPDQVAWLDRLQADLPNLRAALEWFQESQEVERARRLAAALWTFWVVRDLVTEGRRWLEPLLDLAPFDSHDRRAALLAFGDMSERQGDYEIAEARSSEALELARSLGDRLAEAAALRGLGNVCLALTEVAKHVTSDPKLSQRHLTRAIALLTEAIDLSNQIGDEWGSAKAANWLSVAVGFNGETVRAMALCEFAVETFRRLRDQRQLCNVLWQYGGAASTLGDDQRGLECYAESLRLARALGYRWHCGLCVFAMSMVHARAGAAVRATWLLSAIDKVRESTGEPLRPQLQQEQDDAMARLRTQLGDAAFERVWAAGALATLDETFDQALSPVWLGPDPLTEAKPATSAPIISAREQDVLRLVVAGQSDRVIADTLFISRRTASKHVASILSKLEVSTRAEAAVRAVREGLV